MPGDEKVFRDSSAFVVRHADILPGDQMQGNNLQFACCATSTQKVCKRRLLDESRDLACLQGEVSRALNHRADCWGKDRCNAVTALLAVECTSATGSLSKHWALLARAWFKPKWQLWVLCKEEAPQGGGEFPCLARIDREPSKLCPTVDIPKVRTTEQLAEVVARNALGGQWRLFEAHYALPADVPHLLTMVVNRKTHLERYTPSARGPANTGMRDLRRLIADRAAGQAGVLPETGALAPQSRQGRRQPRAARSRGTATDPSGAPTAPAAISDGEPGNSGTTSGDPTLVALAAADEAEVDMFEGLDGDDLQEVLEAHADFVAGPSADNTIVAEEQAGGEPPMQEGEDIFAEVLREIAGMGAEHAEASVSSGAALSSGGAPVEAPVAHADAPEPGQIPQPIVGPSNLGYFRNRSLDKTVARITPIYGKSVSIKCYLHPKCSVAMAEWKLPATADIARWILQAEQVLSTDSASQVEQKTEAHKQAMKAMVAQAVLPGRRRQELIDEAAVGAP